MRNRLVLMATCSLLAATFTACFQDRWPEYAQQTRLDTWIDSVMRQDYLWYEEIPNSDELNYFMHPTKFLQTIVSRKNDQNYSYIDTLRQMEEPSYGFNYSLYRNPDNDTLFNALITYVLPESPASKAGLKRGQWIVEVNDSAITRKNETSLLHSRNALKLQMGEYKVEITDEQKKGNVNKTTLTHIGGAEPVEENPINYHAVIDTENGPTGYIVYSQFKSGTPAQPEKYDRQLRSIFQEFAQAGVSNLIVDLRYNQKGSLKSAQLLASLSADASELGETFANLEFNRKKSDRNCTLTFDVQLTEGMQPLELRQGVIISSSTTSGVTGVLLNCLAPLGKWALVGSNVKCAGVATEKYISPMGNWILNPVTCRVSNLMGEDNAGNSFKANVACSETSDLSTFLPFGNPEETLLKQAIDVIEGTTPDQSTHSFAPSK